MSFQHEYPYGDVHEMNLDWLIQTMQDFINSERAAGNTPTVASVRSYFTHKYPYGDIHELNLDWVIQTALRMEEIGDSVEGDIGELQTRMTTAEGNISTLDNTVGGLSDSVNQVETEIGNINDDVEDLQTAVAQHTAQIENLDDKIDGQVVANPTGSATDTLNTIEIAGTVYGIQGSGGSEVEPNPTGEPTDTLEKIGIDGTIYEVGGSSEPVSKTATGNPIHIEDAADAPIVSGEVTFEPKQDLHGYDKPWAGGAGKNLLPLPSNSQTINGVTWKVGSDGTLTANRIATSSLWSTFPIATLTLDPGTYKITCGVASNDVMTTARLNDLTGQILAQTSSSGAVATLTLSDATTVFFSANIRPTYDVSNIAVNPMLLNGTETDTSFAPYSNICPIEGYTDCEVEVTGKNIAAGIENGSWSAETQQKTSNIRLARVSNVISVLPLETYTFNIDTQSGYTAYARISVYSRLNSSAIYTTDWMAVPYTHTIPDNGKYVTIEFGFTVATDNPELYSSNARFELSTEATPYEPYQSTTYTIDLDGTRYGGKVNSVSGVMTVDRAIKNVTSDILVSEYLDTTTQQWLANIGVSDAKPVPNIDTLGNAISNIIPIKAQNELYNTTGNAFCIMTGGNIRITFEDCDTFEKMQSFVTNNPTQICYELATPFTVQLTSEQIRTLEGTNNISTNMTGMSLEYITQEYQPLVELIERSAGHHYSTQERVVGTWIDGKPLYEKVVDFGALPNATTKDLNHNISDIDTVFITGGYAKNTTSGFVQQLNVPVPSNNQTDMQSQWYFGVNATYIRCFTLTDRTSYDECKVILQYTKTTT